MNPPNREATPDLRKQIGRRKTTLLFAVKEPERNHAVLLKAFFSNALESFASDHSWMNDLTVNWSPSNRYLSS